MRKKMLMSFCAFALTIMVGFAQSSTVTGKVVDDKGSPLNEHPLLKKVLETVQVPVQMVHFQLK
jgi:hypothetical protein